MASTLDYPPSSVVYGFIDHSNINISAQRKSGKDGKFPVGVDDPCAKVIPSKVFDFLDAHHAEKGGRVVELFCYTSDQNVLQHENIGDRKITAKGFAKSSWNNKEKCVDTYMVADAVETIMLEKDTAGILSIWTGDKDILTPVMDKAKKYKWRVEAWTFKDSRSNTLDNYDGIEVKSLDDCYKNIMERKLGWKPNDSKTPPIGSSFKLEFELGSQELEYAKENWKDLVEHVTRKACVPLQTWFDWSKGWLYLILAMSPKDAEKQIRGLFEKKEALQESARSYLEIKFNLRSTCKLIWDAPLPPRSQAQPMNPKNKQPIMEENKKEQIKKAPPQPLMKKQQVATTGPGNPVYIRGPGAQQRLPHAPPYPIGNMAPAVMMQGNHYPFIPSAVGFNGNYPMQGTPMMYPPDPPYQNQMSSSGYGASSLVNDPKVENPNQGQGGSGGVEGKKKKKKKAKAGNPNSNESPVPECNLIDL